MNGLWVCLARDDMRDAVRAALIRKDAQTKAIFVDSAEELRSLARSSTSGIQVAIGPLEDGVSNLNVASGVAHDGCASALLLVEPHPSEEYRRKALLLGADEVLDCSSVSDDPSNLLDEPALENDEIPTLVMSTFGSGQRSRLVTIPQIESSPLPLARAALEVGHPLASEQDIRPRNEHGGYAPLVVFVSGRGGVGKTSIVATMASAAASWGMRVGVCDLDLSCGNLYSCFGVDGPADLGAFALELPPTSDEILACGRVASERVKIWGPCEKPEMAETVMPHVERLIAALRESNDLVLVDTSSTFTDAVAQAAQQCDRLVIVVDGRPGSMVAQARMGSLAVRLGVARTRIVRLANRCGRRGRGEPSINRTDVGLETARPLRIPEGGIEVADCLGEGKVDDLLELESKFAIGCAESLAKMLNELGRLPDTAQTRSLLERKPQRSLWSFGRVREAV